MHNFYFNECLTENFTEEQFIELLSTTLSEFKTLTLKEELNVDQHIITAKSTYEMIFNGVNIGQALTSIKDKTLKIFALSSFTRSPIEKYLSVDEDFLLDADYKYNGKNALNLAIAALNSNLLFTVAVCDALKQDTLQLTTHLENKNLNINNLYGDTKNTDVIIHVIEQINLDSLSIYERLKSIIGSCDIHTKFERVFLDESPEVQQSIFHTFEKARNRNLATPFSPDGNIIKDVTPECKQGSPSKKSKVYELRVYSPTALRIYFYEYNDNVFIAKIGYKSDYKEENEAQNKDIKLAHNLLETMVLTKRY